ALSPFAPLINEAPIRSASRNPLSADAPSDDFPVDSRNTHSEIQHKMKQSAASGVIPRGDPDRFKNGKKPKPNIQPAIDRQAMTMTIAPTASVTSPNTWIRLNRYCALIIV